MKHFAFVMGVAVLLFVTVSAQSGPRAAADELLAADRAFAAAATKSDVIPALTAMFARDVVMTHAGGIAYGLDSAVAALKANPINAGRIEWVPARVSVSGDGQHGFTAGFMTLHRPHPTTQSPRRGDPGLDGSTTPMKYLAYWEKQRDGWRVLAYKRGVAKQPAPAMTVSYVLPKQLASSTANAATIDRYREGLAEVERAFSRDAQTMGMRAAFTQYGDPDAINLGGPETPTWLMGNAAIGAGVAGERPTEGSPVSWGPEKTIVAASGDFGVTIGYIVPNKPDPDSKVPARFAFFTIWKRDSPTAPWKYIAE